MLLHKVGVIGAGQVGATAAQRILEKELADVVLIDVVEGLPQGKALDMMEAAPVEGYDAKITGSNDYKDLDGCDIVVVTAGLPRKPGMSREDLLQKNAQIVGGISKRIAEYAPDSIVIVVTNPLDIMSYLTFKLTGFPKNRVMGMAGVLDTARFRSFIAMELGVSVKDVEAMVLGGHGDAMAPLPRHANVSGIPITELLAEDKISALVQRTRDGGAEIVKLLKTGSAYYAPSSAIVAMTTSILLDEKRILPACALLRGEYGFKGIFAGVPVRLGRYGVEMVVELDLNDEESAAFKSSAEKVKEGIETLRAVTDFDV